LPGGRSTAANGISPWGQVVGASDDASSLPHAVVWERRTPRDLGTLPGGLQSSAFGINGRGQVVGFSTTATDGDHAVLWNRRGIVDLGALPGGRGGVAFAVNNSGVVVGVSDSRSGIPGSLPASRAALWAQGVIVNLGTLPGAVAAEGPANSDARSINDRGQIVGESHSASGEVHAVLWTPEHHPKH
jgi:probable HAF family extracellular repeat protein